MAEQSIVPTLHHLENSQSLRVLWALEELAEAQGTKYNLTLHTRGGMGQAIPDLKSTFPLGKSPIMTVEENGALSKNILQVPQLPGVLTESRLILLFLSETFGQDMWTPTDDVDRRQDIFFQEFANYTLAIKVVFTVVFDVIPSMLPFGLKQLVGLMVRPMVNHWMNDLRPIFQFMEDTLSEERPYFAGKKIGLADFNMSWGMDTAWQRGYFEAKKYPRVTKWYEGISQRPAYKRALEKGGKYNLK